MPDLDLRQHDQEEGLPARGAVGHRAHLDVPGHRVEEALHDEDRERQLERGDHQQTPVSVSSRPTQYISRKIGMISVIAGKACRTRRPLR